MTEFATSDDGTRIAFERIGEGPPIVLVGGILSDRERHRPLAEALAPRFSAVLVDRRGRGESGTTDAYRVEREVEDLGAVVSALGEPPTLYGHSSGAGLALRAAAAGLPIRRLVLHEPPYGPDDEASRAEARELASAVGSAVAEGRPADAIRVFMRAMGTPDDAVESLAVDAALLQLAPTMPYDHAVMGDEGGGVVPADLVRRIHVPTLVLAGSASPPFFLDAARAVADRLVDGRLEVIDGADHGAPGEVVAPVVAAFDQER